MKPSSATIVKQHNEASKKLVKTVKTKKQAQAFLIRAGILSKDGKQLTRPYR